MLLREIISVCVLTLVVVGATDIQNSNSDDKHVVQLPDHTRPLVVEDAIDIQNTNSIDKHVDQLPDHTRPLLYNLKLNPYVVPHSVVSYLGFHGEVRIDIEILKMTKTITLHQKNLIINLWEAYLEYKNEGIIDYYTPIKDHTYGQNETVNFYFSEWLPIGRHMLYLKFTGTLNDEPYGFYRNSYTNEAGDTVWFAGTNFVPTYARTAFPCWDEPAFKARFKIAIKHWPNYTAISNMPVSEVSEIDEEDGKVWTHFRESPVMSTYLVGFLISDFCKISNSDDTVNVWTRDSVISSAGFALEIAQKTATELERYTNGCVIPKVDHVALPGLSSKTVESWGLVTHREVTILYNESIYPMLDKIADSIISQSTYQWFGNAVTPSWWTNIWMNIGIADYLKYHVMDVIYENLQYKQFFFIRMMNLMLFIDNFGNTPPLNFVPKTVKEIELKLYPHYENHKAYLLLRMLSHCLTKEVFHAGLIKYLNKHKYGVVEPEDLWSALQEALNESTVPQDKFRIQEVMDTWIGQEGHPLVTVTRDQQTGRTTFTQEYARSFEKLRPDTNISKTDIANIRWWIPINFATRSNPDFSSTLPIAWLSPNVKELVITNGTAPQDWIIVNIQFMGFYRVNYDTANWLKIADYLDSENYSKVHVLNRAQIVDDAIYLMTAEKLDPEIFMNVTRFLRRETDYIVWYKLFMILETAIKYFAYNDGGELLQPYVLDLMNNVIESIGVRDRPNDDYLTKIARREILEKACECNHPMCLREAQAQLIAYLENPTEFTNSTSYRMKQWIFRNGVKLANESVWYKLLHMYTEHSESTINCLGYSNNLTIIDNFLNMTVSEDSPIPKQDINRVFNSILVGNYPNIDILIDFTENHWDKLTAIYGLDDTKDLLYRISWSAISRKQIQKVKALMDKFDFKIPTVITTREQTLDGTEMIVNKIRQWLIRRNSNLSSGTTPQ